VSGGTARKACRSAGPSISRAWSATADKRRNSPARWCRLRPNRRVGRTFEKGPTVLTERGRKNCLRSHRRSPTVRRRIVGTATAPFSFMPGFHPHHPSPSTKPCQNVGLIPDGLLPGVRGRRRGYGSVVQKHLEPPAASPGWPGEFQQCPSGTLWPAPPYDPEDCDISELLACLSEHSAGASPTGPINLPTPRTHPKHPERDDQGH